MTPYSLDLQALRKAYAEGLDPRSVVVRSLERLQSLDDAGVFVSLADGAALDRALAHLGPYDPLRKPLWGVPFAIKDNIDCEGFQTTAACPEFSFRPGRSATVVERLVDAGAIPLGKTNLDQFATGLVGVRSPYPVPRNSFDPSYVPGGSSSGSAIAVAQGIVSFALGTDTAGSGRVPAGLNNLVGLKPSLGAVPVRGVLPACQTLDCVSIFGLTVADSWDVYAVAAGYDAEDPWSRVVALRPPAPPQPQRLGVPDRKSRIFHGDTLSEAAFDAALALLEQGGHELVQVDLAPFFAVAKLLYEGAWVAERYQAIRAFIEARPDALHPVTRAITEGAGRYSAADAFAGLYRLAALRRETEAVWRDIDALAVPTYPKPVRVAELQADPIGPNSGLGTYTNFVNLLDLCALAAPGPFRSDGFPSGVTFIAPAGEDGRVASLGSELEAAAATPLGATGVPRPAPRFPSMPETGERIEIAVVGAHLSGMPLNRELVALGGAFARSVDTLPVYRLYALPGGPPQRPGLVRVADGQGTSIEVEVWSLPAEGFGRFVATIGAPLGIGTLRLADGTTPKGFLCEAAGLAGAADISDHRGWRRYLASVRSA